MLSITIKCTGCGKKKTFVNEEVPSEQPVCDDCFMPMIAEKVELDTRKERVDVCIDGKRT